MEEKEERARKLQGCTGREESMGESHGTQLNKNNDIQIINTTDKKNEER